MQRWALLGEYGKVGINWSVWEGGHYLESMGRWALESIGGWALPGEYGKVGIIWRVWELRWALSGEYGRWALPGVNEVLCHANRLWCACDGDQSVLSFPLVTSNFDLRPRAYSVVYDACVCVCLCACVCVCVHVHVCMNNTKPQNVIEGPVTV